VRLCRLANALDWRCGSKRASGTWQSIHLGLYNETDGAGGCRSSSSAGACTNECATYVSYAQNSKGSSVDMRQKLTVP